MRQNHIIGVYLAAGRSERMGSDKLRLPLGPMCLGNYGLAAALASGLNHVWVVSGNTRADWIDHSFYEDRNRRRWSLISCPDARLRQSNSLRCGIRAAMSTGAEAAMVLLADQPFITAGMIDELLDRYQRRRHDGILYAAAGLNGLARPPVVFSRRMFPDLLALQGDVGARRLIRGDRPGICVEFDDPDLFMDVDTGMDYASLLKKTCFWKS